MLSVGVTRSREVLVDLLRGLNEAYLARNEDLLAASVFDACVNLVEQDPGVAFTNEICVASFRQNGHPELPNFVAFAITETPSLLQEELSEEQRELLEQLSQDQLEELCRGEFAALCTLAGVGE